MPLFKYVAMDTVGKEIKGCLEAASEQAVNLTLKEQGLFLTAVSEGSSKKPAKMARAEVKGGSKGSMMAGLNLSFGQPGLKRKDLMIFTRQLSILLDAGLPLVQSLRILEDQSTNKAEKNILGNSARYIEEGLTFSEALTQNPKSFDKLYINMVRAGEASGAMEKILNRLAELLEKAARLTAKIKSAMVYPIVVLSIAVIITSGLMIFIVPRFETMFAELLGDKPLPALTRYVIEISNMLKDHILATIIVIVFLCAAYKLANRTAKGKFAFDWIKYRMPLFGPIISKSAIARFSRTLSTLMSSGVPVLNALQIVKETSGSEVVSAAVQKVHDAVKEGESIAKPLAATHIFPKMVVSMIQVGEQTGKLPDMLERIADTYDEDVDNAVDAFTSMLEPLMIVVLAVLVGTIVIALFMPMITIITEMGKG
ncbi:MAG: pilus assembly protein PilC [Lentisphaerae bacterium GWF2_49_21]|nr:MAG: pilus assembly protein PilC [Lentisphaerae bacterium GWF2_49_21]